MKNSIETLALGDDDHRLAEGIALCRPSPSGCSGNYRHAHAFHQVTLVLSSPGHVEWHFGEGRSYSGRPSVGDIVICPAYVPTLVRWERPFESASIRISTVLLDGLAERADLGPGGIRPTAMRRDLFAGEVVRKLADEAPDGRDGGGIIAESLGTALAVHLLREYGGEGNPGRRPLGLSDGPLRRVTGHIEANLDGDLSVGLLAALAGLSPYHFIRLFRATTGTTPRQYVIRRRVDRAGELIRAGCGIAEAAARAGFSGQGHLHQHMRRLLGVTPGELAGGRPSPNRRLP